MNDLNGLDWSSKPGTGQNAARGNYSAFSSLKPVPPPISGRASPLSQSQSRSISNTSKPGNDSFSNLVAFSNSNPNRNVSLQEQQRQRETKLQKLVGQKQTLQEQWANGNDDVWNNLGSGRSTPAIQAHDVPVHMPQQTEEDDLFAAFNEPPVQVTRVKHKFQPQAVLGPEDDDPFGLAEYQAKTEKKASSRLGQPSTADDDDVLGDLGRPIEEKSNSKQQPPKIAPSPEFEGGPDHPQDKAVAELVEMGFPAEKARRALEATDTGTNVQAAVGIILTQAHEHARQKTRNIESRSPNGLEQSSGRQQRPPELGEAQKNVQRDRSATPSGDPAKVAQELGTAFIKSAGAFWKSAQKQVQQAVGELNSDSESGTSTPKWMREATVPQRSRPDETEQRPKPSGFRHQRASQAATDEALMLETERPTPPPRAQPRSRAEHVFGASADSSRDHSPAMPSRLRDSNSPQPGFTRQQDPLASMMRPNPQQNARSARDLLSKQVAEEQASQAYTSSNRRRKIAPANLEIEGDLLNDSPIRPTQASQQLPSRPPVKSVPIAKSAPPIAIRPSAPTRSIPQMSTIALKASHTARSQGNAHFRRGDYSAAHEAYSTSLRHIPASHPLQIVLLTNRALTALKTGQPKIAVMDTDTAITLIGTSKGEAETIDVEDDDGKTSQKPMREYYGKALTRKAEAFENLERWAEAASVWRLCVEDGHGGAAAIQGRARAEKAAVPKPTLAAPQARKLPARTVTRSAPPSTKPAAAVSALRAQNQAADKLDDEKFALTDAVSARINGWKGGKEGNLRALLASLDNVLWEGAGWKKIGMADLVLPNKVKINYMKGIGKCHPDKIPTNATTEQRMVAGAVFSILNEAWDKFKTENKM